MGHRIVKDWIKFSNIYLKDNKMNQVYQPQRQVKAPQQNLASSRH